MSLSSWLNFFHRKSFYELEEPVSSDRGNASFYRIKGKKDWGVKVFYGNDAFVGVEQKDIDEINSTTIENFNLELEIGKYLNRCQVPTPRYIGIYDIKTPDGILIKGLIMEIIEDSKVYKIYINPNINPLQENFIIDEINIRNLKYQPTLVFQEKLKTAICKTLNTLIQNTNYTKKSIIHECRDVQGLYSESKNIFYLIDFGEWSNRVNPTKKIVLKRRTKKDEILKL